MDESFRLLVVDDEPIALKNLVHVLKKEGYDVTGVQSGPEAIKILERRPFHLVLTDLRMERVDGMEVLKRVKELYPDAEVVMITGYATVDSAVEALKAGAYHYIAKPYKLDEVRKIVGEVLEKITLKNENVALREQLRDLQAGGTIVTDDPRMRKVLETARQVAATDSNVMILGESGTGKELLARFIHNASRRKAGPLMSVNCGAFDEELLSNELFGHEKGAFTGANEARKGLVEAADGGTLFLDEVTEMSLPMQVKLLRLIQEKEVLRLGGTKPVHVDVRFIAATNRNLQEEVKKGTFRQDLYFRLNVVSLTLPPLAERKGDLPLLIHHFIQKYARIMGKEIKGISPEALDVFMRYDFPGNIRELENIVERAIALSLGDSIGVEHLPDDMKNLTIQTFRKRDGRLSTLDEQERAYIEWVLGETGGNKSAAAQILGIDRVSLWRKLKRYGME